MPESIGTLFSNISVADPNNQISEKASIHGTTANIQQEAAAKIEKIFDPTEKVNLDHPNHSATTQPQDTLSRGIQTVMYNNYDDLI